MNSLGQPLREYYEFRFKFKIIHEKILFEPFGRRRKGQFFGKKELRNSIQPFGMIYSNTLIILNLEFNNERF